MIVDGVDFVMLDADTAGCVCTFLTRGSLDPWRLAVLGICYRNLTLLVPTLAEESRSYFARLERLAGLVLRQVERDTRPP
jgi:hypothetical protein